MKTVVISGVPRSGKSLLAQAIYNSTKCSVVHLDKLCGCVRKSFSIPFSKPDEQSNIGGLIDDFQDFLVRSVKNIGDEFDNVKVFETTFIESKEIAERLADSKYICIYLGYPNLSPKDKLKRIREYGNNHPQCWTNNESDGQMIEYLSHFIDVSKKQEIECKIYGIPFFDGSADFQTSFIEAKSHIMSKLNGL